MRVLVVAHGFPPLAQGGSEIYADVHARALAAAGDEVWVLTRERDASRPEYAVREERRDGLRITWVNNTFRAVRRFEESYENAAIAAVAAGLIETHRPDVAHIHHLTCLSTGIVKALSARRIPSVLTLHDYWLMCHRGQLLDATYRRCPGPGPDGCDACVGSREATPVPAAAVPLARAVDRILPSAVGAGARRLVSALAPAAPLTAGRRRLDHMREVCGGVTHFLAPSRHLRDRFVQFGIASERITVSPYGFDRAPFPAASRPAAAAPLRLGFVGSLMVSKAPHLLLEAHRRLPEGAATVTLLGAPADYHGDDGYCRVLDPLLVGPGVRVCGARPHRDIPAALASLDVLVVPSIWEEASPLAVWEAMLAGLPVIASRIGGIPEIVEHGRNGLLFEPGNVDDLHRTLRRVLDEPDLLTGLAAGARATAVRSIDDDVRETRQLYERLATAAPVRRRRRVGAVVLNHRTTHDTELAVSALLASNRTPDVLIVVDNDVADDCRAAMARHGGDVSYQHTGRNLGFSGGVNVGIRAALERGVDEVLLVNADVVLPPDCIGRLQDALDAGGAGIVGPLVRSRALPDFVASAGIDYHARTGRMRHRAFGLHVPLGTADRRRSIADGRRDAVSGCAMLISRAVLERIGLFDERYFYSFEEIDFCLRARAAGFTTRLVASGTAYHEGGQSIGARSLRRFYFAARNHLLLASTLDAGASTWRRTARAVSIGALNVAHALRGGGGTLPERLAATARGVRDHLRGRYGPDRGPYGADR